MKEKAEEKSSETGETKKEEVNARVITIPSPVWPHVNVQTGSGSHVTRIQLDSGDDHVSPPVIFTSGARYDEVDKDTRQADSIVTHSLLMMMKNTESSSLASETEDISVSNSSNPANSNTNNKAVKKALNNARRSFRRVKGSMRSSKRKVIQRTKLKSKSGSLRSASSVEAVKELWNKTGMRTNGRKLLIESSAEESANNKEFVNTGYESDNSEVSVPRERDTRDFPKHARRQVSSSSSSSDDNPRSRQKFVRKTENSVHFDKIQVDKSYDKFAATSKQVRFNYPSRVNSNSQRENIKRSEENNVLWDKYYGSTEPGLLEAGGGPLASNFTLDLARNRSLRKLEKRRKNLRCCCKISCFLLLLISFLLVIVTVTFFLTKGKKYFGAL